ncbi:MAG: 50S ribosomal protein L13 [Gemmatimonadota bacterium]|nr:MAG: 50S ribosomal protein L13 [Gemmatimonadota bacterium]
MRTYALKAGDIQRKWYVVDADGQVLGRLASQVAHILRGKHKPCFSTHLDTGDHVIIINAQKVRVTGRKSEQKCYYRYSGYPGGLKVTPYRKMLASKPERILELAIKGMLPKNRLGRKMSRKLKVYARKTHPHQAQQPEVLEIK